MKGTDSTGGVAPKARKTIVLLAIAVASFLAFNYVGRPVLIGLLLPADCDEGMDSDARAHNGRGDLFGKYIRVCTGFGTIVEYSIVLQLHGEAQYITLARYDELVDPYPRLHWANDNTLVMEFRKDHSVWSRLTRVGDIRIIYDYSSAEPAR